MSKAARERIQDGQPVGYESVEAATKALADSEAKRLARRAARGS